VRLRARIANSFFGELIDCFGCLSIWIAIPLAFAVASNLVDWILTGLALANSLRAKRQDGQSGEA
jgi:hypothetical protein